jgi:hypothetical protein
MRLRVVALASAALLAGCGGGNALTNPDSVSNPEQTSGQKLSFIYYQKCINPIFDTPLPFLQGGVVVTNTCASGGCHDTTTGTGGALRIVQHAQEVDLSDPANTPDVIRTTDMYRNYYSAQGATVIGSPTASRLLAKPLLTVLHGGGQVFGSAQDVNALRTAYWISNPVPQGQDEFSVAGNAMFTPPDPATGTCNTQ